MKKGLFRLFIFFALLSSSFASADTLTTPLPSLEIYKLKPEGQYVVYVFSGGRWVEAGSLSFDRFFREKKIDLNRFLSDDNKIKIRLVEKGGGAAHIDSVSLGGLSPEGVRGIDDALALKKLSKRDFDVVDAFHKDLEVIFPANAADKTLVLTARVEGERIGETPFQFPASNLHKQINENSEFYTYRMQGKKSVNFNTIDSEKPFFKEFSLTGSGHPSGFTYGWVKNDGKNLYVKIDFTPDDTMDGDKDYTKVYVKTDNGVKEFKASVVETRWGKADFTYTDKVAYQHKVYEFKIPFREIGIAKIEERKELAVAFAAYGTASPGDTSPAIAFDPVNNRYLVVYSKQPQDGESDIYGQLINCDGTPYGSEFVISNATNNQFNPSVAYDSTNQRFLVAWQDYRSTTNFDIYGQLVNANGTLYGPASNVNFVISDATNNQSSSSVAYDSANQRFLVAWSDYRSATNYDIYGQLVNANGTLYGPASNVNFVISNATDTQFDPSVAYDSTNQRFLVAWYDYRSTTNWDIYGQLVNANGTLYGPASNVNFVISDATNNQNLPSVAYDSTNQRFLVAWSDFRSATNYDIYGQLVNANGTLYSTASNVNFVISNATNNQSNPSVAYDSANQRFLVAWSDLRSATNYDIYGQLVNANGTLYSTASNVNFVISAAAGSQLESVVAYNSDAGNFLVAFYTDNAGVSTLGFASVGTGVCQGPSVSVPAMTEWGMIAFMLLAGLGSLYYMRRAKRIS